MNRIPFPQFHGDHYLTKEHIRRNREAAKAKTIDELVAIFSRPHQSYLEHPQEKYVSNKTTLLDSINAFLSSKNCNTLSLTQLDEVRAHVSVNRRIDAIKALRAASRIDRCLPVLVPHECTFNEFYRFCASHEYDFTEIVCMSLKQAKDVVDFLYVNTHLA